MKCRDNFINSTSNMSCTAATVDSATDSTGSSGSARKFIEKLLNKGKIQCQQHEKHHKNINEINEEEEEEDHDDDSQLKSLLRHQNSLMNTVSYLASNLCEIAFHDGGNDAAADQFGQANLSLVMSSHSECSESILSSFKELQDQLKEKEKENNRLKKQLDALRSGHDASSGEVEENSRGSSSTNLTTPPPIKELSIPQNIIDIHQLARILL